MSRHILETDNLKLTIEYIDVFLQVQVESPFFSVGVAQMLIDFNDFKKFYSDLNKLYDTLKGTAKIEDLHKDQYIEFKVNKRGHILIEGCLKYSNYNNSDLYYKLNFEYSFEQTYLQKFVKGLINEYSS